MKKIAFLIIVFVSTFFVGMWSIKAEETVSNDIKYVIEVHSIDSSTGRFLEDKSIKYSLVSYPNDGELGGAVSLPYESKGGITTISNVGKGKTFIDFVGEAPGYLPLESRKLIELDQFYDHPVVVTMYFTPRICVFNTNAIGTKYQILDQNGLVVETWTQMEKDHEILRLPAGEYKLHVVSVPKGYQIPSDKKFTVEDDAPRVSVIAHVLGNGVKNEDKADQIMNVPNTLASQSMILYGIGAVVTLFGVGMIYKYAKQN